MFFIGMGGDAAELVKTESSVFTSRWTDTRRMFLCEVDNSFTMIQFGCCSCSFITGEGKF